MSEEITEHHANFGFWTACAFTCNYVVGTGFLTLPFAFASAGVGLSLVVLLSLGLLAIVSIAMILDAMARASTISRLRSNKNKTHTALKYTATSTVDDDDQQGIEMRSPDSTTDEYSYGSGSTESPDAKAGNPRSTLPSPRNTTGSNLTMIDSHKWELPELCDLYLGTKVKNSYMVAIGMYMYGTLWVYSCVFSKALSTHVTLFASEDMSYYIYLVLFACLVIPTSCMELREQVPMQVTLAVLRIVMMLFMIGTTLPGLMDPDAERPFYWDDGETMDSEEEISFFNLENIHHIVSIGAFAFIFHHSIPALSHPVKDKSQLMGIFTATIAICMCGYSLIGVCLALYFGDSLEASSNLNWSGYAIKAGSHHTATLTSRLLADFVVLFPAVDVASAFPLNAITLGNSIMSSSYSSPEEYREASANRNTVIFYRLIAACPPIVAAAFMRDLGSLTAWTGLSGLLIVFVFPPLLAMASSGIMDDLQMSSATYYTNFMTSDKSSKATLCLGTFLSLYCCWCLIAHPPSEGE